MPEPNMGPIGFPGMAPDITHAMPQYAKPPEAVAAQPPPKAYPCSTCGKGFARRSDLARHGEWSPPPPTLVMDRVSNNDVTPVLT